MAEKFDISLIQKWAEKTNGDIENKIRATVLDLSKAVIQLTPVDEGFLINAWQVQMNTMPSSQVAEVADKNGSRSLSEVNKVDPIGGVYYMVNLLPYAKTAEYGLWGTGAGATIKTTRDGYSIQAPYGMVRVTIANFQRSLRESLAK